MITGVWGKKIGMTQVFEKDKVVPVTVIDVSHWIITQVKNEQKDGYNAVQIGRVRSRYENQPFSKEWLKDLKTYFVSINEVHVDGSTDNLVVGDAARFLSSFNEGENVDVLGVSIGRGFAGAVKRHGFAGARASHGSKMGKRPGSLSFMRSQGRVIKGKRLPGHMGTESCRIKNLQVVKIRSEDNLVLVKGPVPGKAGSLVFMSKA